MIKRDKIEKVIGKSFADKLDEVIFLTEGLVYTRREMVEECGCANFIATVRLSKVLRRLKIDTAYKLYKLDPYSLARASGIGEACIFVAMCILDANDYDPIKWWDYHDNVVKFSTFKHHAIRRASKKKHEIAS